MMVARRLREARTARGLTVSALAARAGTSQPTLTAYEQGRVAPGHTTLERILGAAGYAVDLRLVRRQREGPVPGTTRGDELLEVLDLAEQFPASLGKTLTYPVLRPCR